MSTLENDSDLKARVARLLDEQVRPVLQMDGGNIELLGVGDGVVRVRFLGACSACPSTIIALVMDVEQQLRKSVPGVEYLEAVP